MKTIKVSITGITPLLMNNFTDEAQQAASSGTRGATVGNKGTPEQQATKKLYKTSAGKPCIPQPNMLRCIIDAGKYFKNGKSKVTTQKSSLIPACVDIEGVELELKAGKWSVDTRPVRIPATGGRILAHRPRFDSWSLEFTILLNDKIMTAELLREIVDAAGAQIGLGDFRPDCKGPFGKFRVDKWVVKEAKQAA